MSIAAGKRGGDWASGVEAARLEVEDEREEESMERLRLRAIVLFFCSE